MGTIIFIIILAAIVAWIVSLIADNIKEQKQAKAITDADEQEHDFREENEYKSEEYLECPSGYNEYPIVGMNFRDTSKFVEGKFYGSAEPEDNNEFDPWAIAIYDGEIHLGYLPRGNEKLWTDILNSGGYREVNGIIRYIPEIGKWSGEIVIKQKIL